MARRDAEMRRQGDTAGGRDQGWAGRKRGNEEMEDEPIGMQEEEQLDMEDDGDALEEQLAAAIASDNLHLAHQEDGIPIA